MRILMSKHTPGCPMSGGVVVFTAANKTVVHGADAPWGHLGRNSDAVRVQTVITDVPGSQSAPSLVRRP
jgi:hypothetical protein